MCRRKPRVPQPPFQRKPLMAFRPPRAEAPVGVGCPRLRGEPGSPRPPKVPRHCCGRCAGGRGCQGPALAMDACPPAVCPAEAAVPHWQAAVSREAPVGRRAAGALSGAQDCLGPRNSCCWWGGRGSGWEGCAASGTREPPWLRPQGPADASGEERVSRCDAALGSCFETGGRLLHYESVLCPDGSPEGPLRGQGTRVQLLVQAAGATPVTSQGSLRRIRDH